MSFIVKNTTIHSLFRLIAPHSCRGCGRIGEPLCNCCKNYIISNRSSHYLNHRLLNLRFPPIFIVDDRQNLIGKLIDDYKYRSIRSLVYPLADMLNQIIPKSHQEVIVVPLPTIDKHIRERGFDHTLYLAKQLAKLRSNWQVKKYLVRNKNTVQVGANKKVRQTQAKDAYAINPKLPIKKEHTYLLLDDVLTTGYSMLAAEKKLRQAGAKKIILATLAISHED